VNEQASSDVDWAAWIASRRQIFEGRPSLNQAMGLELIDAAPGWAKMRMRLRPDVMNPFGSVHGGATAALIDSAAGSAIAAGCAPDSDRIMGTIDMQVHFLERAKGDVLTAEGRMVRAGRAVAIAQVEVRDDGGALVAMGTATFRVGAPGSRRNED
jgi:acyl-CoA thioesterase